MIEWMEIPNTFVPSGQDSVILEYIRGISIPALRSQPKFLYK